VPGQPTLHRRRSEIRTQCEHHIAPVAEHAGGVSTITAKSLSTAGFDTLSFRIAMVRPITQANGVLATQDVTVTLTDSHGVNSPPVRVSDFSDALDSSMGLPLQAGSSMPELLSMVAIPLNAFKVDPAKGRSLDLANLSKMTLKFANAPNDGTGVALTDLELQNFGRVAQ